MKNHILSLFLLLTVIPFADIQAQNYEPMLTDGKVWVRHDYGSLFRPDNYLTIKVEGDSIYGGEECKMISFYENGEHQETQRFHDLFFCDYEDEISWFTFKYAGDTWYPRPIIDMNCTKGDSLMVWHHLDYGINMPNPKYLHVLKEFTVELFGHRRKCLATGYKNEGAEAEIAGYWIEGVGATNPNCVAWGTEDDRFKAPYKSELISCHDGNELIYTKEAFESALALAGIGTVESDNEEVDINAPIYNLQGLPVTHPRSGEIYIRAGRKIFWP